MRRLVFAGLAAACAYLGALRVANWLDCWERKRRDPKFDTVSQLYDYRHQTWKLDPEWGGNAVHPIPERPRGRHLRGL